MVVQPHWSCEVLLVEWIDWLDLPKLTTLRTIRTTHRCSDTFNCPRHITLESDSHPLWMMIRHAQSHRCVSSRGIRVQEWRHNPRKHSLHPPLTNRHRRSSTLLQLITERHVTLFVPHTIHHQLRVHHTSATNHIMIIAISNVINVHRIVGTILPAHSPKPLEIHASPIQQSLLFILWKQESLWVILPPFTSISSSVFVWIIFQRAFKTDCGNNPFSYKSVVSLFCTNRVWWIGSDRCGRELHVLLSLVVTWYGRILSLCDNSTLSVNE